MSRVPIHRLRIGSLERSLKIQTAVYEVNAGTARYEEWCDVADAANTIEALTHVKPTEYAQYNAQAKRVIDDLVEAFDTPAGRVFRLTAQIMRRWTQIGHLYDQAMNSLPPQALQRAESHFTFKIVGRGS